MKLRQDLSPELMALQDRLHHGFDSWTLDHASRYPRIGALPYWPNVFKDQRIDRPARSINGATRFLSKHESTSNVVAKPVIYLAKLAILRASYEAYIQTVGSKVLADKIVTGFLETPAFPDQQSSPSLVEYAVSCLEDDDDTTIGLTSAHLDSLSDIGEFTSGFNMAMTKEHGFKYADRVKMLVNMNMTRQTYSLKGIRMPIPWLINIGAGVYWGVPPGESAEKHGITKADVDGANALVSVQFVNDKREKDMVFGYVPTGSGAIKVINEQTGEVKKIILKDASYTAPLSVRCFGGIIPVNRHCNEIAIGSVITNRKPEGVSKKDYEKMLTDEIMAAHAKQAHDLTGLPVEFTELYQPKVAKPQPVTAS